MTSEPELERLNRLVGTWTIEATHPAFAGLLVRGTVNIEWLEGKRFLMHRSVTDHPDFPDALSVIGFTERDRVDDASGAAVTDERRLTLHYFDSRGVFRVYEVSIDDEAWRMWRNAPGFSQRFTGTFGDGMSRIAGIWQLCQDDEHWVNDLEITYRRNK